MPGTADLRIQQPFDQPQLFVDVDRTRAQADRTHAARCGQQPAGLAQRQLPDVADLLAESEERRQLQHRDADAAIPAGLARRPGEHPDHGSAAPAAAQIQHVYAGAQMGGQPIQILGNLASITRGEELATVTHYDIAAGDRYLRQRR